jgi:hypothetical protein
MATDLVSTTTSATSALYDAAQETYLALCSAALESQERLVRLTRLWVEESRASAKAGDALLQALSASARAVGEAVQELATAPAAVAGLELPYPPFGYLVQGGQANGAPTVQPAGTTQPAKAPSRSRSAGSAAG